MADALKVQMGVCSVTLGGVDLGHTMGGVEVSYQPQYKDVVVDLYGNTPVDSKLIGEKLTVKVPLAEFTVANLNKSIVNSTLAGAGNTRITLGSKSGKSSVAVAAVLVVHPIAAGVSRAYDIALYKAVPTSQINLVHAFDKEKVIQVEFEAYIDETKADGSYLGLMGDSV
jgi:hypothetical protein